MDKIINAYPESVACPACARAVTSVLFIHANVPPTPPSHITSPPSVIATADPADQTSVLAVTSEK